MTDKHSSPIHKYCFSKDSSLSLSEVFSKLLSGLIYIFQKEKTTRINSLITIDKSDKYYKTHIKTPYSSQRKICKTLFTSSLTLTSPLCLTSLRSSSIRFVHTPPSGKVVQEIAKKSFPHGSGVGPFSTTSSGAKLSKTQSSVSTAEKVKDTQPTPVPTPQVLDTPPKINTPLFSMGHFTKVVDSWVSPTAPSSLTHPLPFSSTDPSKKEKDLSLEEKEAIISKGKAFGVLKYENAPQVPEGGALAVTREGHKLLAVIKNHEGSSEPALPTPKIFEPPKIAIAMLYVHDKTDIPTPEQTHVVVGFLNEKGDEFNVCIKCTSKKFEGTKIADKQIIHMLKTFVGQPIDPSEKVKAQFVSELPKNFLVSRESIEINEIATQMLEKDPQLAASLMDAYKEIAKTTPCKTYTGVGTTFQQVDSATSSLSQVGFNGKLDATNISSTSKQVMEHLNKNPLHPGTQYKAPTSGNPEDSQV